MDKKEKRNAGRPKVVRDPPVIRGIVKEPEDPANCIEFVYDMPLFIKYIWQIFKKMNADRNYITFYKDKIIINSRANHSQSSMRCVFDCTKVGSYYCEEPLSIAVDCQDFASITKKIDAKFKDFRLYCHKDNRHSIVVRLTPSNGVIEKYSINLTDEYDGSDTFDHIDTDHMILIKMGIKYLKRTLTEFKKNVRVMSFVQEDSNSPVFMSFHTIEGTIGTTYEIPKEQDHPNKKKELQTVYISKVPEDHIFRVIFRSEFLRPFCSSMPNEMIDIYIDENKPIKLELSSPDRSLDISAMISIESYESS